MVGGEDIAIRGDDDAGAKSLLLARARRAILRKRVPEKLPEHGVFAKGVALGHFADDARGVDVHHAGGGFFNDRRKTRPQLHVPINRRGGELEVRGGVFAPEGEMKYGDDQQGTRHRGQKTGKGSGDVFHKVPLVDTRLARMFKRKYPPNSFPDSFPDSFGTLKTGANPVGLPAPILTLKKGMQHLDGADGLFRPVQPCSRLDPSQAVISPAAGPAFSERLPP